MRFRGELDMERLEVPDKFGDLWTTTRRRTKCPQSKMFSRLIEDELHESEAGGY